MSDKQPEYKFKTLLERAQSISFVELMATITVVVLLVAIFMLYEARTAFIQHYVVADVESVGVPAGTTLNLSERRSSASWGVPKRKSFASKASGASAKLLLG